MATGGLGERSEVEYAGRTHSRDGSGQKESLSQNSRPRAGLIKGVPVWPRRLGGNI